MAISFPTLGVNLRSPLVAVEFDNSRANQGPLIQPYEVLMIGEKTASGSAAVETIYVVTSADQAKSLFGVGSIMHLMAKKYFRSNGSINKLYGIVGAPGGTAATGTIVVAGPATASGVIALYIAGQRLQISVTSGDSANSIAAAINTAVNAAVDLPVTGGVSTNTVTLTSRHTSVLGNDVKTFHSLADGEVLPGGVGLTINQVGSIISGAGVLSMTNIIAAMGEQQFNLIMWPYGSAAGASETSLLSEMSDRWGPIRQIEGHVITAARDTQANLLSFGNGKNSQFISYIGVEPNVPSLSAEIAASAVGQAAKSLQADPARPLQTLQLLDIVAAGTEDRFTYTERNLLLFDGIATQFTDAGGVMRIERMITAYQTNSFGLADTSFLDIQTFATLSYIRFQIRARWTTRFPRHKLASDASAKRFGPGQAVMTPSLAKAELVAMFMEWEELALVEDLDDFKDNLVVEVNSSDPNRLDVLLPPNLVNQLRVSAFNVQFRL